MAVVCVRATKKQLQQRTVIASYADALWAGHAIFLPHEEEDCVSEPKERVRRRLGLSSLPDNPRDFRFWTVSPGL